MRYLKKYRRPKHSSNRKNRREWYPYSRKKTGGFTLLELIVAVSVIGVLVALLLPAIQYAREKSRQTSCQSNLRELGIGLTHHNDALRALPSGVDAFEPGARTPYATWLFHALPFLEQEQVHRLGMLEFESQPNPFDPVSHSTMRIAIPLFACPADSRVPGPSWTRQQLRVALTSYVGNVGRDFVVQDGMLFRGSHMALAEASDGLSNTLLAGERPPSTDLWYGWWYAGQGQRDSGSPDMLLGAAERNESANFLSECGPGPFRYKQGSRIEMCDVLHYWSLHQGGTNFLLCDGSVRLISYGGADILIELSTRDGNDLASLP